MKEYDMDMEEEQDAVETEADSTDLSEDGGFLEGYEKNEEVAECAECGTAIKDEKKKVTREIEEETFVFCSNSCADEFEESIQ